MKRGSCELTSTFLNRARASAVGLLGPLLIFGLLLFYAFDSLKSLFTLILWAETIGRLPQVRDSLANGWPRHGTRFACRLALATDSLTPTRIGSYVHPDTLGLSFNFASLFTDRPSRLRWLDTSFRYGASMAGRDLLPCGSFCAIQEGHGALDFPSLARSSGFFVSRWTCSLLPSWSAELIRIDIIGEHPSYLVCGSSPGRWRGSRASIDGFRVGQLTTSRDRIRDVFSWGAGLGLDWLPYGGPSLSLLGFASLTTLGPVGSLIFHARGLGPLGVCARAFAPLNKAF